MNKVLVSTVLLLLISGTFVTTLNSALASELVENSWNTKASMKYPRQGLGVVTVGGKIYAIGGSISAHIHSENIVGTNERYDPKTDTWTTLASMPTPRANFAIAADQGKIYCIGGETNWNSSCYVTEVYDIATDSWSTKASIPLDESFTTVNVGQNFHANTVNGNIFVTTFAGDQDLFVDTQHLLNGVEIEKICLRLFMYNPATDSWAEKTSVPTNLAMTDCRLVSAVVYDKIFVICSFYYTILDVFEYFGVSGTAFTGVGESKVLVYDTKIDEWHEVTLAPMGAFFDAYVGVTSGLYVPQRIYMLQAERNDVYDPVSDTWAVSNAIPTARQKFGVAVVDDFLYVIGGYTTYWDIVSDISPFLPVLIENFTSIVEQYVPIGYKGAVPAPETSNTLELPNTLIPINTPEQSNTLKPPPSTNPVKPSLLTYLIVTLSALTIGIISITLFLIAKKKQKRHTM